MIYIILPCYPTQNMTTSFVAILTFLFFQTFAITTSSNVTCIQSERQSLLVFKQTLKNTYTRLSTWRGVECCDWHGVACDNRNGHVVKLDLRALVTLKTTINNVTLGREGELSHSLQNLKHLRYLDLSMNEFSGSVPEFLGSFKRLEYLNLSNSFSNREMVLGWVSSLLSLKHLDLSGKTFGNGADWFHTVNMLPSLLTLNLADCHVYVMPSVKSVNFTSLNSLDLSGNEINSTIPVWLANLTNLMHLNLASNHFHGKIHGFIGMFSGLVSLDLSFNSIDTLMPDLLCNLSSLVHLDLSSNKFSGHIPSRLSCNLSSLVHLDLSWNMFSGHIPTRLLCNLSSLVHLDLSWNAFSGHIPVSLGLLLKLTDLYLLTNQLNGNIPKSLWQLSKLKNLDLCYNSLVGALSETHFTKLKNLNYLGLSGNSLDLHFSSRWVAPFQLQIFYAGSCNMGPHFPNWLQTQANLQRLDLSNSSVRDIIPEWFQSILYHIIYLDLSNNQISGKLPLFDFNSSNQIEGRTLKMNSNKFEGSLATFPSNVKILDLSDNLLSGHVPQTYGTTNLYAEVVNLSNNRFTGSIPVHLCRAPGIQVLDLSQNRFSGRIPECLGNLISLQAIDLSYNNITGVIPSSLGSLEYLISLHLHNNRLEGYIPVSFQNFTQLVTLDLGSNFFMGTIPFWIGENLSCLTFLNLGSNKFRGKIPLQLCQLDDLQYLSLAHNSITGTIPGCLGKISGMITTRDLYITPISYEENIFAFMKGRELLYTKIIYYLKSLDLSHNNIVGEIPNALMHLVGLKNLNLSRNLITGQIPVIIGDLKQLESLDLSKNKLTGSIPQSLSSLYFLSYLNLSFNNLSGPIPVGNQLQTLDDQSIYEGNTGLCGPPVSRSCIVNDVTSNHVVKDEGQDDNESLRFYEGMGPGFVVGFVGLLGSLHFIRSWRVTYFDMLEKVYVWLMVSILLNLARLQRELFE